MTALAMKAAALETWTVYKYPKDFPNAFVVRRWQIKDGVLAAQEARVCYSLKEARRHIPKWCTFLGRDPNDDPCILESWI